MDGISKTRLKSIIEEEVTLYFLAESNVRKAASLTNLTTRAVLDILRDGSTTRVGFEELDIVEEELEAEVGDGKAYSLDIGELSNALDIDATDEEYSDDDRFLSVTLFVFPHNTIHVSGDNINRMALPGVHLSVSSPESPTGEQWSALRKEISNTLRHEIEHMIQELPTYYEGDYEYDEFILDGKPISQQAKNYYLQPHEVSAHIIGYAHNASSIQDLENEIRSMLQNWARKDWNSDPSRFIAPEDVDLITNAWMDWAKKHLRKQRFR